MKPSGQIVSLIELASIWGVHRNTTAGWVKKGCPFITKADRNCGKEWEFDTAAVAQWRLSKAVKDAVGDLEQVDDLELRRRKLRAETVMAELDAAKMRGLVGDLAEFERQVTAAAIEVRSRMRQMVARVAPMVIGENRITAVKEILSTEVDDALRAISHEIGTRG